MKNIFLMISLLLSFGAFASGGSGSVGGGGGMKPELGRLIDSYQLRNLNQELGVRSLMESIEVEGTGNNVKEVRIKPSIYLNIKDITEFTLKDGSVIRVDQLLE